MNLSRSAIALYMGLVFVSGAVLGVFGDHVYTTTTTAAAKSKGKMSAEEFRKQYLNTMKTRLKLSDEQVTKLGLILDETRAEMDELHRRQIPEQQALGREQREKIRGILNSDQQAEYEKMIKERDARQKKGNRGNGPGF